MLEIFVTGLLEEKDHLIITKKSLHFTKLKSWTIKEGKMQIRVLQMHALNVHDVRDMSLFLRHWSNSEQTKQFLEIDRNLMSKQNNF